MSTLVIPATFNGPPTSGQGGWTSGMLATLLLDTQASPETGDVEGAPKATQWPTITVVLSSPPPLQSALPVVLGNQGTALEVRDHHDELVARANIVTEPTVPLEPVLPIEPALVHQAEAAYSGRSHHCFPTCYVCGFERPVGDGMFLQPGPVPGQPDLTACHWQVGAQHDLPHVWAALDCPGGWTTNLAIDPMVLGTFTVSTFALPQAHTTCTVMAHCDERRSRTMRVRTSVWQGETLVATASAVWVRVNLADFG